jgi:hypothetical protein
MDIFQGTSRGKGLDHPAPPSLTGQQTQNRPDPFASGEQTVLHGLSHPMGIGSSGREIRSESLIHQSLKFLEFLQKRSDQATPSPLQRERAVIVILRPPT